MSDEVNFQVYFKGKFVTHERGDVTYEGGEIHFHMSPAVGLFVGLAEGLGISLYGQRIWYKFPWEDLSQCKILCDGSDNFQRLIAASMWTKSFDIYLEAENAHDHVDEPRTDEGMVEEQNQDANEDMNDDQTEICEEEARVEALVADIVDSEDEDDEYQRTPPQSDCEDEGDNYVRYKKGSGKLEILQVFESTKDFREAVLEYALKEGYNIKYGKGGGVKAEATCGVKQMEKPCRWRIYCSFDSTTGKFMVKTFQSHHTCFKDGHCRILTNNVIAHIFLNDLRNDPKLRPRVMQDQIQERYNLDASYDKIRKGKQKALQKIQAEFDEQFSRIKDYEIEILRSNPGSTTKLVTVESEDGVEKLDRFYVCFAALRKIWLKHCRPIFGIDGCFLKSTSKGQLLTAVGRDSNNQIYPIAWAYVQVESTDTWAWFIRMVKRDLQLGDGCGFTLVSDRQKGLLKAVSLQLPKVEHRMCARHIYANMKSKFPKKARLKSLFWEVVESPNKADFNASMKEVKEYDIDLYNDLMSKNPKTFSRAYFQTTPCCEDALNNFSESYNSAIEKARALPLVEMLETMRRQTMVRIDQRKTKTLKHQGKYSLKVSKMIALEKKERKWCKTTPGPTGVFESYEKGVSHTVNMRQHTCTCRRWDLTGIPCRHALRVVLDRKTYQTDDLISDWYLTSSWRDQYNDSIMPLNGLKFWKKSDEPTLQAPPRDNSTGRKKNPEKRKKGINESPKKGKKVTQHGRKMHCQKCGIEGHNAISCINPGVSKKPRPPKKARTDNGETIDCVEGPSQSQPSQPSPND